MSQKQGNYMEKLTFFREKVSIYPVSCEPLANGRSDIEWLEGVLAGGAKIVQLRDKHSDDRVFYLKSLIFREKTKDAGALFIVNNRVDIALLAKVICRPWRSGNWHLICSSVFRATVRNRRRLLKNEVPLILISGRFTKLRQRRN